MPTGDNPNSRKNLKPITSVDEARRKGRKGGIASAESRALRKTFAQIDAETTTTEERAEMWAMVKKLAKKGNLKAFELYRDTVGEKPREQVEVNGQVPVLIVDDITE